MTETEKLQLLDRVARSLHASPAAKTTSNGREAVRRIVDRIVSLPVQNPDDGFAPRDHDRVIYGAAREVLRDRDMRPAAQAQGRQPRTSALDRPRSLWLS